MSTVNDLNRFFRVLLDGDVLRRRTLVGALATPAATRAAADAPWRTHSLLLASMRVGERWAFGHTGFWGRVSAYLPDLDACVSATLNESGPIAMQEVRGLLRCVTDALDELWRRRGSRAIY